MKYFITKLSSFAYSILEHSKEGRVHSIYQNTINIQFHNQMLALQCPKSALSPISLQTTCTFSTLPKNMISFGDKVYINDQTIVLKDLSFSYQDGCTQNLALTAFHEETNDERLKKDLLQCIIHANRGGLDTIFYQYANKNAPLPSILMEGAKNYLKESALLLSLGKEEKAAKLLSKLIGLGIGLTPSGDDFLVGLLASQILCQKTSSTFFKELRISISKGLSNTNDISRAFLSCALEGQFSLPICMLASHPSKEWIANTFGNIGHSSGYDTLCGVLFGMSF